MDALAQLALMTKAKLVFENPDSFLSFPALSPINYKANELRFTAPGASPEQTLARLRVLSEFSRNANSKFVGTIFQMEEGYLWDKYKEVLDTAVVASDLASPEDAAALNQAIELLTDKDQNGLSVDSVEMSTYKQYRDAWFNAGQGYKDQQLTAESSSDPAIKSQWLTIDEPRLRALVQQAEADWRSNGFKEQIERAQQLQAAHAARLPQTTWDLWKSRFIPFIDVQEDTNTIEFAVTGYNPEDIFDQEWPTFHLTRAEITQLAAQAPAELRNIFAIGDSSSTVEALSFEYRSVLLTRPWFRKDIFDARFWRLPDPSAVLSDGGSPPQGAWPAYASALVFVRNISLTMRGGTANQPAPELVPASVLTLNQAMLRSPMVFNALPVATARPMISRPTMTASRPMGARFMVNNSRMAKAPPSMVAARPMTLMATSANFAVLRANTFQTLPVATRTPATPPPSPQATTPSTTTQQGTRDEVSVLAFICKRIPKCPNPDPGLTW